MNEQLQTALAELITSTLQAKEFIVGELPEVVRQLLAWKMCYSMVMMGLSLIFCIVFVFAGVKIAKKVRLLQKEKLGSQRFYDNSDVAFEWFIFTCCSLAPAAVVAATFDIQWLQIWIAPKVWLIEYAASLVK